MEKKTGKRLLMVKTLKGSENGKAFKISFEWRENSGSEVSKKRWVYIQLSL